MQTAKEIELSEPTSLISSTRVQTLPVVLITPMWSCDPDYCLYPIQELQGRLEGIFPRDVTEVNLKSIEERVVS